MREIFKVAFLSTILSVSLAITSNAKTQGHYFGVSAIKTNFDVVTNDIITVRNPAKQHFSKESKFGFGLEYKYAFNFKNFFLAPKVLYDRNNFNKYYSDPNYQGTVFLITNNRNLKYSYGAGFDIGYDINKKLGIYTTIQSKMNVYNSGMNLINLTDSQFNYSEYNKIKYKTFVYGLGIKYEVLPNIDLFASHEILTRYGTKDFEANYYRPKNYNISRAGISYKFSSKRALITTTKTNKMKEEDQNKDPKYILIN